MTHVDYEIEPFFLLSDFIEIHLDPKFGKLQIEMIHSLMEQAAVILYGNDFENLCNEWFCEILHQYTNIKVKCIFLLADTMACLPEVKFNIDDLENENSSTQYETTPGVYLAISDYDDIRDSPEFNMSGDVQHIDSLVQQAADLLFEHDESPEDLGREWTCEVTLQAKLRGNKISKRIKCLFMLPELLLLGY
jgi:hypothetical protein